MASGVVLLYTLHREDQFDSLMDHDITVPADVTVSELRQLAVDFWCSRAFETILRTGREEGEEGSLVSETEVSTQALHQHLNNVPSLVIAGPYAVLSFFISISSFLDLRLCDDKSLFNALPLKCQGYVHKLIIKEIDDPQGLFARFHKNVLEY
ncbi:hypothetical protein PR048_011537, partial [Dryococelus australis]